MRLTVLGCNGTYPTPGRPGSGYLIEQGTTRVWCDAGPGTLVALMEAGGLATITAIVLSHQHLDHCLDLLTAHHVLSFGPEPRGGVPVFSPQTVWDRLVAFVDPGPDHPFLSAFEFQPVADGNSLTVGALKVSFAETDHSVTTLGSRWEADGRALAYSADTGTSGSWDRLAEGADLFLCEATYQGDGAGEVYPHHLTAAQAGQIAARRGVGALVLTHLRPVADPLRSRREAEAGFDGPVSTASAGLVVEL